MPVPQQQGMPANHQQNSSFEFLKSCSPTLPFPDFVNQEAAGTSSCAVWNVAPQTVKSRQQDAQDYGIVRLSPVIFIPQVAARASRLIRDPAQQPVESPRYYARVVVWPVSKHLSADQCVEIPYSRATCPRDITSHRPTIA